MTSTYKILQVFHNVLLAHTHTKTLISALKKLITKIRYKYFQKGKILLQSFVTVKIYAVKNEFFPALHLLRLLMTEQ